MSTASAQANLTIGPFGWHLYLLAVAIYVLQKLTHSLHPYLLLAFDVFFILYTGAFMSMRFFGVAQCVGSNVPLSIRNGWWKYPLYALGTLMGAYAALINLGKDIVNSFLLLALCCFGTLALKYWAEELLSQNDHMNAYRSTNIPFLAKFGIKLSRFDIICFCPSIVVIFLYITERDWLANNICAASLCLYALKTIYIARLSLGLTMLALFLVYDIYFVFGSNIMQTLALQLYGPIKLIYPLKSNRFVLLGLGDILAPGVVITFCLRLDLLLHLKRSGKNFKDAFPGSAREFNKAYFAGSLVGYSAGFAVALAMSYMLKVPQPGLLYIIPFIILGIVVVALARGEMKEIMAIDEESLIRKLMEEKNTEDDSKTHKSNKIKHN
eukprot:TRINITY_DN13932_c0_g1_i2.p1 TRINITY_DN13932_c0_g1~~TRINITY_DN13932_c0_g1_i2.p1  ORF type:complete len:382 (-),score=51.21 TRINITY_DN13932_c0_g1_i2:176-1321(-)